ncbi:LuxR family transcriptional regulator [Salmonella enterica subsp. enterica serovar Gallinarum]|nr:LuxR family transcriptional regulator [Salmonella enterica subsp. enterica serovar Gallinarum]
MQVIMFDRQSIFIHGMKISLQQHIPGISIQSVGQAEELWQKIESAPDALVMLDSGLLNFAARCYKEPCSNFRR